MTYAFDGLSNGQHRLRVNELGSMFSTDGSATGEQLRNLDNVRSQDGHTNGTFDDDGGRLVGDDSMIGRSIVVLGNADDNTVPVAQCTVGRDNDEGDVTDELVSNVAGVTVADCLLTPTVDGAGTETGHAKFELTKDGRVGVSLFIVGLAEDGVHPFHIHDRGNTFYAPSSPSPPHGDHFVGNFTGGEDGGDRTEVGQIGSGNSINAGVGASRGIASVSFVDSHVTFNGTNSIIGRSLVIQRPSDGARVAHCVIGIQQLEPPACEAFSCISIRTTGSTMRVLRAMAVMTPASGSGVAGTVELIESPEGDTVDMRYFFTGLAPGEHHWHIHTHGDTERDDGRSPGNHFVGACDECRTFPNPQEVGYIGDGALIVATDGTNAFGTVTDTAAKLNGANSVVGRSIVVHGDAEGDPAKRVAQGVIGRTVEAEAETVDDLPRITEAVCRFEPTHGDANFDVTGDVVLTMAMPLQLSYNISGLSPGEHAWSVNEWGLMIGAHDAASTGDRFVGVDVDRQGAAANEVGAIGDGAPLVADADGRCEGTVGDRHVAFDEMNTVIGRSIVISSADGSAREAMCVIGITREADDDDRIRVSRTSGAASQAKPLLGLAAWSCTFLMASTLWK